MSSSLDTSSDSSQSDGEDMETVEMQRIRAAQAAADELSSTDEDSDVAELTKNQAADSSSDEDDDSSEADAAGNVSSGVARARARANIGDDDGATTSESEDEESGEKVDPVVARARARASMGDAGDESTSSDDDDDDDDDDDSDGDGDGVAGANAGGRASSGGNKAIVGPASDSDEESQGDGGSDSEEDDSSSSEEESSDEAGAEVSLEELQEMKRDGKEYRLSQEGKKRVAKLANKKFARPNKNAPQVASSKIRVSRFREVVPGKKVVRRDPRFSDVSGSFNDSYFRQSYKFLESYQEDEIAEIRKQLKKSKKVSDVQRRDMQASLTKLQQMRSSWRKRETRDAVHSEVRKANRDKIKKGQTPFFPSKRSLKESVATREYEYLTKNKGKLVDTIMKKKRRKLNKHSHGQKPGRF